MNDNNPRYSVCKSHMERGYKWVDWNDVPEDVKKSHVQGAFTEYEHYIPTEVIIMLLKEFQNDTGLIGKIMQEEICSKDMANRHLDIIEKLITVIGGK